jgi:COPII coat assembly protein SEC16
MVFWMERNIPLYPIAHCSPELEKSVKEILLPQVVNTGDTEGSQPFGVTASSLATSMAAQSTIVDPNALATYNLTTDFLRSVRSLLMQGDRQSAIRKAVDQKMWGHALLIASSVDQNVWRETVEQFIRSELRDTGTKDFDSLRFLYGVLGGEGPNAVTELLPPINRMVSSIHPSTTSQAPRFGSWKESLGMVLLNQGSMDTSQALIGLGSSLVNEGRVEAGHSWYITFFR